MPLSPALIERRRASVPPLRYPESLPIAARRDDVMAAIAEHQVVIVAGETGSGKSTQIPKMCLDLGRGVTGLIGHTQPRRLAARTIAARVADELGTPLGDLVGYTVRFTDQVSDRTLVRVMTDGILLAELGRDRMLRRYDTLIIDEAHERSLNIDFLLGYLTNLLPRRPDLKLIVTSATIDTERFARHFDAPVVEVSGRSYPVEMRYRPPDDPDSRGGGDQTDGIRRAVAELSAEGPGDILVFLSGEREIRDTAAALGEAGLPAGTDILPLYARLSAAEQQRVFRPHPGRRIVLATNVAETSITVPGVRYVVDPGTARISRFSRRTKVQRLPIEPVSQASADQRAGRCGRVAPGICIRLYAEDDYDARPPFTEPEILRTNLASVILQMAALRLGDVAAFPFVDPPDARAVRDAVALLTELGALDDDGKLTRLGRRLARLPVDPRFGRMILEADREGCVREVLVIAAALSIQDVRERPTGAEAEAAALHARFAEPDSDFLAVLNLWRYLEAEQRTRSSSAFRRMCLAEHIHHVRVREWQDLVRQLRQVAADIGIRRARDHEPAAPDAVHRAVLAGLLSHVGAYDRTTRDYRGARQARFLVAPGSVLHRRGPAWVMAGELVETTRLWARMVARIDPGWIEPLAAHLVRRSYGEPAWDARRGAATTTERVTLYGLPIVEGRRVSYARVDPAGARRMFIEHALVAGDWSGRHRFAARNADLLAEVRALEDRARRRDLVVPDDRLVEFFAARLPEDVASAPEFDRWWRTARADQPDLLTFTLADLVDAGSAPVDGDDFPTSWRQGDLDLAVSYTFGPGAEDDGVTVHVPLAVLNRVAGAGFDWQVPGHRLDLVTALLRSLPKDQRRHLVPAPDRAREALAGIAPADGPLLDVLARRLAGLAGVAIAPGDFDLDRVPAHLRVRFRIEDAAGRGGRRRPGPRRPPPRPRARGPGGAGGSGARCRAPRAARLGRRRRAAPRRGGPGRRRRGRPRLPGARRRGRDGRCAGAGRRGRAGPVDGARHPPAGGPGRARGPPGGRAPAASRARPRRGAGALPGDRRPGRRQRRRRGRSHRGQRGRPGLGRGRLRPPGRRRPGPPAPPRRGRRGPGRRPRGGGCRPGDPARRPSRADRAPGGGRHAGPGPLAGGARLRRPRRARPPARRRPLPGGRPPAAGQAGRAPRARPRPHAPSPGAGGRVHRGTRRAAPGTARHARGRRPRVAAGGAAGQPVRPGPGHRPPGQRAAGQAGDRRSQPIWRSRSDQYGSRSSRLSSLPEGLRGSTSAKSTDLGSL